MSKRKKNNNTKVMIGSVVALLVIVLVIKGITIVVGNSISKDKDKTTTASSGQVVSKEEESKPADDASKDDSTAKEDAADGDSTKNDTTAEDAATDDSTATDDAADGDSAKDDSATDGTDTADKTDTADGKASTSMTLQNEQFDITNLDTTCLDWGQGSNVDELNRPDGCDQYQEKYGKYNANFIGPSDEKVIYLTFDEGYEYGCTPDILATLKEKEVQAVFFVTKPYVEKDPELVQQMIDEGHEVGNHSVTHPAAGLPSETVEQQQNEITENHQYVKDNFGGYDMHLFRYPAGKFSEQSLAIINNLNYKSVFWSFAYLDYDVNNQPDETESLQKLVDHLHPGGIFLLHAESWTNTHILGSFIDQARAAGYEFRLFE